MKTLEGTVAAHGFDERGMSEKTCSAEGCIRVAVTWLEFRDQPGHVHVCGPCEALDREWCDVTASGPMPCDACTERPIYVAQPNLLEGEST